MNDTQRSSQTPPLPSLSPQSSTRALTAFHRRHQSVTFSTNSNPRLDPSTKLRVPSIRFDSQDLLSTNGPGTTPDSKRQNQPAVSSPPSNCDSFKRDLPPRLPAKTARYYEHALSNEDSFALVEGMKNHNVREWAPQDMFDYHEARKELGLPIAEKLDRAQMVAGSEQEKRRSQDTISKMAGKVGRFTKLSRTMVTEADHGREDVSTKPQPQNGPKSLKSLHSSVLQLPPVLLIPPILASKTSLNERQTHTRLLSHNDVFPRSTESNYRTTHGFSPQHFLEYRSDRSGRLRSPLTREVLPFQANPEITFDPFLAPHKAGKGEAFRGSENAMKP